MESNENTLNSIVSTTLDKIKTLVDANTIVGQPIRTEDGTTVIPVSKVSFGFASGGSEFNGKAASGKNNFGGGSGAGVTISPVAFLFIKDDMVKVTPISAGGEPIDRISALVPEMFDKITALFKKEKPTSSAASTPTDKQTD